MAGAALLILIIGAGLYGLMRGPAAAGEPDRSGPSPGTAALLDRPRPIAVPRPIVETEDAERFARSIAAALYNWDTRAKAGVNDWAQPLVDASDPDEANGVAADVRAYIPSDTIWDSLRAYGTRQRVTIEAIGIPDAWTAARSQATLSQVPAFATAFTVTGTARRHGTWNDEPVKSARPVSFTVFVDCPPEQPCRLLRLSRPDAPLQ
jgi:hypothetical protein